MLMSYEKQKYKKTFIINHKECNRKLGKIKKRY